MAHKRPARHERSVGNPRAKAAKRERRRPWWRWVKSFFLVIGACFVFATGVGIGYAASLLKGLPAIRPATFYNYSAASVVYDRNGRVIGRFTQDGDRQPITSLQQVSPNLVNAFIAAEDKTFYHNIGINPMAMARALVQDLLGHRIESGASTITQQTVKLALFPEQQRTIKRKIQEIALALELNQMLSKDEIMTDYMNWVYMGRMGTLNVYGVNPAARILFHKSPKQLNLPEAAFLAAIPNNPYYFSPYEHFSHTIERQHYILRQMLLNQMITKAQYDWAMKYDIKRDLQAPPARVEKYPYLMVDEIEPLVDQALVRQGLYQNTQEADAALATAGYKIYTSIDLNLQNQVDKVLSDPHLFANTDLPVPGNPKQKDLYEVGFTLIDNQSGAILAIGGGRDFSKDQYDHSDLPRQPGSSIKPLVDYGPAIDQGKLTAGSIILDAPVHLPGYPGSVQNDDGMWHGYVTVRQALTASLNIPAIKVLQTITPQVGTSYLAKMGITTHSKTVFGLPTLDPSDAYHIGTAIGGLTNGLTVQQLTAAYTVFPNQGVWRQPYLVARITDRTGNVLYQNQQQVNRVFSPQTAYIMTSVLHDVVYDREPYPFTGTALSIGEHFPGYNIAGKTGTTDDRRDGWFIGFTQKYTAGIWMGYNHHQPIPRNLYGMKFVVWNKIMTPILEKDPPTTPFPRPDGVVEVPICKESGALATPLCKASGDVYKELFIAGTQPTQPDKMHVLVQYVKRGGHVYLATTNTPVDEIQTGVFLNPPTRPSVRTYDSSRFVPTQPDPLGGQVLASPGQANAQPSLPPPGNVTADAGPAGIAITWNSVPGASHYIVWRATDPGGPYANISGPLAGNLFLDPTPPPDAPVVYYEVSALDDAGHASHRSRPVAVPLQLPLLPDTIHGPAIPAVP